MARLHIKTLLICVAAFALPAGAYAQQNNNVPPSINLCSKQKQINGIWKLKRLSETPAGALTEEHKAKPHQYVQFNNKGLYFETKKPKKFRSLNRARQALTKASKDDVWQYILGDKGVMYFYKNQVFSHSMYCGKVTKASKGYRKGAMILTPTETKDQEIYATYERVRTAKRKKNTKKKNTKKK